MTHGPAAALHAVLDFIVDNYQPIAAAFEQELDALEQDVFAESYKRDNGPRLYHPRKELTRMRMAVTPMQDILAQLMCTRYHRPDGMPLSARCAITRCGWVTPSTLCAKWSPLR